MPMTTATQSIIAGLAEIIHEIAGVPAEDIRPESDFAEELEIDSLTLVELVVAAEEHFGVSIPDSLLKEFKTVGSIAEHISGAA